MGRFNATVSLRRQAPVRRARRFLRPRYLLLVLARVLLARPWAQRISRLLYDMSLRAMGVLNYENDRQSGERWFIGVAGQQARVGRWGPRPVVLDVGANEGDYANLVLDTIPDAEVHAFEPHPSTVQRLHARLGGRATVVDSAVGEAVGSLELYDYDDGDGSSHASPYAEVFSSIHGEVAAPRRVPVVTLDAYLEEQGWPDVALLKIDTEGHELRVLEGATAALSRGLIDCIQFEFNEMNVVSRSFLRDFHTLLPRHRFFRLLPKGVVPLRGAPLEEIFAFQNIVAVRADSPLAARLAPGA